jgi:hypothetical protein
VWYIAGEPECEVDRPGDDADGGSSEDDVGQTSGGAHLHEAEQYVAHRLARVMADPRLFLPTELELAVQRAEAGRGSELQSLLTEWYRIFPYASFAELVGLRGLRLDLPRRARQPLPPTGRSCSRRLPIRMCRRCRPSSSRSRSRSGGRCCGRLGKSGAVGTVCSR